MLTVELNHDPTTFFPIFGLHQALINYLAKGLEENIIGLSIARASIEFYVCEILILSAEEYGMIAVDV